ncbi:hypothetical protein [Collimonas sp. PA-H2]|uniref:hypothetical protein n=1 Tax=Collimonas sp. PA-H2 TaxID=1881062 RepID=UPI00130443A0|nr:hypothetical protein [Collimonas sp. PA-H2]
MLKMARYIFQSAFYLDAATSPLSRHQFVKLRRAGVAVMTSILQILSWKKAGLLLGGKQQYRPRFLCKMLHGLLAKIAPSPILQANIL